MPPISGSGSAVIVRSEYTAPESVFVIALPIKSLACWKA